MLWSEHCVGGDPLPGHGYRQTVSSELRADVEWRRGAGGNGTVARVRGRRLA